MRLHKSTWPHCGVMQCLQEYSCLFLFQLWNSRDHIVSIFIGKYVVIQVFSMFYIMSLKFIATFSSLLTLHFYHYVCLFVCLPACLFVYLFDVCYIWGSGATRSQLMGLPLFTTVHWWTRIMVVIVIRTRSSCCYKSFIIKSPCG